MDVFAKFGPSLIAASDSGEKGGSHSLTQVGLIAYTVLAVALLFALMAYAKKGLNARVFKNPVTQWAEQLYLFIEQMCVGTIGPHGRRYVPMIMTFWMVIFIGNLIALFFPTSITADLSFNVGLALISIGYVQYEGIRSHGLFGHLSHFAGPKLGWKFAFITAIIFVIEIISEVMKNVSLSLRLYGNIEGGHQAADAMNKVLIDYYIPLGAFLVPIKLLTVIVQAMIFCLLTCVYLSLVTHHDDHGGEGAH